MPHRPPPRPLETDRALFRRHLAALTEYTDALRDERCRRTTRFDAHVNKTLHVFAPLFTAWNPEILFVLYMHGPSRFSQIKRRLSTISSRVLTDKLRSCMAQGFITHEVDGPNATYDLSARGGVVARHLHPLLFYLHTHPPHAQR
jgi:DNA-binding HxlR family transcriptional regulator